MSYDLTVEITGADKARAALSRLVAGLKDRTGLHAEIAGETEILTQDYLRALNRHRTANRLGASPTYHYEQASRLVEGHSDEEQAVIRIPRRTGLGRAFRDMTITPRRQDITYLTIPDHARTYGKRVGDFQRDTFDFRIVGGRHPALVWADGPSQGQVAFWLKRRVFIPQDRTLLPSDDDYTAASVGAARRYVRRLLAQEEGGPA